MWNSVRQQVASAFGRLADLPRWIAAARSRQVRRHPLPVEMGPHGSRRQLPTPAGVPADELLSLLRTVSIDDAPAAELHAYLHEDFERFVHTWGLTRGLSGRCLEIGANPYFTTVLLREHSVLELTLTNFFGPTGGIASQGVTYRRRDALGPSAHPFEYHVVNVETDPLPFADGHFDVVLFCEVIEHLLSDPVAALIEIKRVLRQGGTLILTTPNVARLENVARLIAGANVYDPYSGYGPYGRHNREFTRHEIYQLLQFVGFDVTDHFTADVHDHAAANFTDTSQIVDVLDQRLPDLGQYLFFSAINTRPPSAGRPSSFFRSLPDGQIVDL